MIGDQGIGTIDSNYYPDTGPEYLQKWIEGYALLSVIIVGATANLFSLIIIRNKELNLIRDFSRLLQSQVTLWYISRNHEDCNKMRQVFGILRPMILFIFVGCVWCMLPTCQRCYFRCTCIDERGNIRNIILACPSIRMFIDLIFIPISFFIYLWILATLSQLDPTAPSVYVNNTSVLLDR